MQENSGQPVREFWDGRARDPNVPAAEVTHRDIWQRWLEIEMLKRFVGRADRVLDVGCGNGYTTWRLAPRVREIVGIDYSEEMIRLGRSQSAREDATLPAEVSFEVADILAPIPPHLGTFDAALSERCLINLRSWPEQQTAIANIARVIRPGGRFLFLEGSQGGRDHLNELRRRVGLEEMPAVWHNLDFEEERTLAFVRKFFEVRERLHFGVYDFIARVVHPLLVAPEPPKYDARINEVAARLALVSQEHERVSRVLFLVLERTGQPVGDAPF